MKLMLQTIAVAFSMFSAVPMPQFEWNARNMRYTMCAFPFVGLVIGLINIAISIFGLRCGISPLLLGALLCCIPVLVSGGIHLDGYCDTCDALASHAPAERKQEILKDPHIGSFAVIRLCLYFLFSFALWATLPRFSSVCILLLFVLSRVLSGIAIASFPLARSSGLAYTFAQAADKNRVRILLIAADILICILLFCVGAAGIAEILAAHLVFVYYRIMSEKQFGGLSGDLAGWFVQTAEFWMLAAVYLTEFIIGGLG